MPQLVERACCVWGCTRLRLVSHGLNPKSHNDLIAAPSLATVVRESVTLGVAPMHWSSDYLSMSLDHAWFTLMPWKPSHRKNSIRFKTGTSDFKVDFNWADRIAAFIGPSRAGQVKDPKDLRVLKFLRNFLKNSKIGCNSNCFSKLHLRLRWDFNE